MDLAYFNRSKARILCWLIVPPALIAAAIGSSSLYTYRTNQALENRLSYLRMIPQMERKIDNGKGALGRFWSGSSSVDSLNTALNRYANEHNLLINSLTAAELPESQATNNDKLDITEFKLTAQGSIVSLMKFCHTVQNEQPSLTLGKTMVSYAQMNPNPEYRIELTLRYHKIKS